MPEANQGNNEVTFLATLPEIQSAILIGADNARVKLDIPLMYLEAVSVLMMMQGKVLEVRVKVADADRDRSRARVRGGVTSGGRARGRADTGSEGVQPLSANGADSGDSESSGDTDEG